jgi:GNAT superfamily N-acetyltransferase
MAELRYALADAALSRRLERAEARANAAMVEARAERSPASGAAWIDVAGTWAMFDGVGSPITQTFGLGLFAPATDPDLDRIEAFFAERGERQVMHEVSPMADPTLLAMLPARGYRPMELSTVLHRPTGAPGDDASRAEREVRVRLLEPGEESAWADVSARGWEAPPALDAMIREFALLNAERHDAVCFAAEIDGAMIATGSLVVHEGVAVLAGASTLPAFRGRGAQTALLAARLRHAAALGADLAAMAALPGSTSQQNAERRGFRVAYTRIKWGRTPPAGE